MQENHNNPGMLASDYGNLANTFGALGDLQGALKMNRQPWRLSAPLAAAEEALVMNNLGDLFGEMGHPEEAKGHLTRKRSPWIVRLATPRLRETLRSRFAYLSAWPILSPRERLLRRENAMNFTALFLSPIGRISRKTFWIGVGALIGWSIVVFVVLWSILDRPSSRISSAG